MDSESRRVRMGVASDTSNDTDEHPLISVVTVVFNAVATIEATIQSVVTQAYPRIDFVIIDGGSTDGTLDVVQRYRDRIGHVSSGKDRGIYDAMNKGIAAARGDWILFLNSGDTLASPEVLQAIFGHRPKWDADVIYGNAVLKSSHKIMRPPRRIEKSYFYFETLCHQSVFASRELFNQIGAFGLDYRIIADREWLLRVAEAGGRFAHVDVVVSVWDPEGFSSVNAAVSHLENADFQTKYFTRGERALLPWLMRVKNLRRKLSRRVSRFARRPATHV